MYIFCDLEKISPPASQKICTGFFQVSSLFIYIFPAESKHWKIAEEKRE